MKIKEKNASVDPMIVDAGKSCTVVAALIAVAGQTFPGGGALSKELRRRFVWRRRMSVGRKRCGYLSS